MVGDAVEVVTQQVVPNRNEATLMIAWMLRQGVLRGVDLKFDTEAPAVQKDGSEGSATACDDVGRRDQGGNA